MRKHNRSMKRFVAVSATLIVVLSAAALCLWSSHAGHAVGFPTGSYRYLYDNTEYDDCDEHVPIERIHITDNSTENILVCLHVYITPEDTTADPPVFKVWVTDYDGLVNPSDDLCLYSRSVTPDQANTEMELAILCPVECKDGIILAASDYLDNEGNPDDPAELWISVTNGGVRNPALFGDTRGGGVAGSMVEIDCKGPAGGIAQLPDVASNSSPSGPPYAAVGSGLAAGVLALTVGAWYARRRRLR